MKYILLNTKFTTIITMFKSHRYQAQFSLQVDIHGYLYERELN